MGHCSRSHWYCESVIRFIFESEKRERYRSIVTSSRAVLTLVVGGVYNTRGGGNRIVHITEMVYGNEATPPISDEYRGWMETLQGGAPVTCNKQGGWESSWLGDGSSTCNASMDAVSVYTGPLRNWYKWHSIGKLFFQTSQKNFHLAASGRLITWTEENF
jgi:hypothetical protein